MTHIEEGATPLMYACQQGREKEVLDILFKKPKAARARDRTLKTALHYCAESAKIDCAEAVLRVAPDLIEAKDEDGYTILHLAVISGNKPLLGYLLERGANVNVLDNEQHSAVHWATVCGESEALNMVLRAGANVSTPDIHGGYPLHYAAQMCGPGGDMGGDPKVGLTVLQKLLSHGVDVNVVDKEGRQPILWAASAGSAEAILALVQAGASVEAADKDGLTGLHCAASRGHTECLDTLVTLCGANVDVIDSNGCTPLFYAVTLGHADSVQVLLNLGAEPNRQDRKGRTPAHCGAAKGQLETLRILSQFGANFWLRNVRGDFPLHEAVASGRIDLVIWLLSQKPNVVNTANNDGRCPIHVAAMNNNIEMIKILFDHESLVNPIMRSSKGQMMTPIDVALHRGNRACAKYLQSHGGVPYTKITTKSASLQAKGTKPTVVEAPSEMITTSTLPITTAETTRSLSENRVLQGRISNEFDAFADKRYENYSSEEERVCRKKKRRKKGETRKKDYEEEEETEDEIEKPVERSRPRRRSDDSRKDSSEEKKKKIKKKKVSDSGESDYEVDISENGEAKKQSSNDIESEGEKKEEMKKVKKVEFELQSSNGGKPVSPPSIEVTAEVHREQEKQESEIIERDASGEVSERKPEKIEGQEDVEMEDKKEEEEVETKETNQEEKIGEQIIPIEITYAEEEIEQEIIEETGHNVEEEEEPDIESEILQSVSDRRSSISMAREVEGISERDPDVAVVKTGDGNEDGDEGDNYVASKGDRVGEADGRSTSMGDDSGASTVILDSGVEPSPRRHSIMESERRSRVPRLCRKDKTDEELMSDPISVTQAVQNTIRKYQLERSIFYQLLELKRQQIRAGRTNEQVLVKRLVDEYQRAGAVIGLKPYTGPYRFKPFERYLYEQLHNLQTTGHKMPKILPTDGIEELSQMLNKTKAQLMEAAPMNPILCTHSTHRCYHAAHAYTGIPCAAYITKLDHHTMPKDKPTTFLPRIDPASSRPASKRISARPVTLELSHGLEKQVISLPTDRMDKSKRYYVTFTIKGLPTPPTEEVSSRDALRHRHAKSL